MCSRLYKKSGTRNMLLFRILRLSHCLSRPNKQHRDPLCMYTYTHIARVPIIHTKGIFVSLYIGEKLEFARFQNAKIKRIRRYYIL